MAQIQLMAPHERPVRAIVLPRPRLTDSVQRHTDISYHEAMDGTQYTYVQTSPKRIFKYSFEMERGKAEELRLFFEEFVTAKIRYYKWDGTVWIVQFMSSQLDFTTISNTDYSQVDIDFEALQIA